MMKFAAMPTALICAVLLAACQTSDTSEASAFEDISSDALTDSSELTGDTGGDADTATAAGDTSPASDAWADQAGDDSIDVGEPSENGTTVTFTTYIDAACTQTPPQNSEVLLDTTVACNVAPKASISELFCYPDKITYMNHPNNQDCSSAGIFNELPVGVCQEFPGPVQTWKLIVPESYSCLSAP